MTTIPTPVDVGERPEFMSGGAFYAMPPPPPRGDDPGWTGGVFTMPVKACCRTVLAAEDCKCGSSVPGDPAELIIAFGRAER